MRKLKNDECFSSAMNEILNAYIYPFKFPKFMEKFFIFFMNKK